MEKSENIKILFSKEEIENAVSKLAQKLNERYGDEEVSLICVLKGSVMFMTDLARKLTMPVKIEFIRLSSYGSGTKSSGIVNAIDISLPNMSEKNVIIVEDIIDSGHTAKFLVDFMKRNFKFKSLCFCSLLDKKIRREADINPDYYGFEIDDKFIVGYGLDYNGLYRNLPFIGYME